MKWSKENPLVIVLVVVLFVGGLLLGRLPAKIKTKSIQQEPARPLITLNAMASVLGEVLSRGSDLELYPSLDGRFSAFIYPLYYETEEDVCIYGIIDHKQYEASKFNRLIENHSFECAQGPVSLNDFIFMRWAEGNKFVHKNPRLEIIDVEKGEKEIYDYDQSKYYFVDVNRTLEYWLFRKKDSKNKTSYVILDQDKKVVMDNIDDLVNYDRGVLYDEVNDGFLFMSRTFSESENLVSTRLDFLSLKDMTLRNILTTGPIEAPGMGCSDEFLKSKPGEIILYHGCLTVDDKYLDNEGNIHIKL